MTSAGPIVAKNYWRPQPQPLTNHFSPTVRGTERPWRHRSSSDSVQSALHSSGDIFCGTAHGAGEKWVQGGFKAKMDRKEAIAILGLKCVNTVDSSWTSLTRDNSQRRSSTEYKVEGRPPSNHDRQPPRPWWIPIPREQNKRSKRLTGEDKMAQEEDRI